MHSCFHGRWAFEPGPGAFTASYLSTEPLPQPRSRVFMWLSMLTHLSDPGHPRWYEIILSRWCVMVVWPFAKISVHISLISLVVFFINDLVLIYILDESLTDTWFTKSFLFLKIAFYSPDVLGDKEILMKSNLSFVVLIVILGLCLENRSQV